MATTTTTSIISPTPASDKMHIQTEGENSGFAAPAPVHPNPVTSSTSAPTQESDEKDKNPTGLGRVRSLLTKKRSLKNSSTPEPTSEPASATQKPHIASTTIVKDPTVLSTDFAQPKEKESTLDNPTMPQPEPAAPLLAPPMPEPQVSTATETSEPQLSRRYASPIQPEPNVPGALKSPTLPQSENKSILAPSTRSNPTTGARGTTLTDPDHRERERPRASRTTSRSAPGSRRGESGTDTDSAADFSSEEEDEADEAGYLSPVSHNRRRAGQHGRSRTEDMRSRRSSLPAQSVRSVRTSRTRDAERERMREGEGLKRSGTAMSRRSKAVSMISTSGGVFASGAGTIGPDALPGAEDGEIFRTRATEAARALSVKQSKKITKEEIKEGKALSKILNQEGKTEKQNLKIVMKELSQLQSAQKKAIKEEMRTHTAYSKASKLAHAAELAFMEAQRKLQVAQAGANAAQESLNSARAHGELITSRVQEKNREVEMLRAQKAADVREREVKMATLKGKNK